MPDLSVRVTETLIELADTMSDYDQVGYLERLLERAPCIDSFRSGLPVVTVDLGHATKWPRFTAVALGHGFAAAYAFPMRLRGQTIGALNLFRRQPGTVAPGDVAAAQAFADMATIGIMQQRALAEASSGTHPS